MILEGLHADFRDLLVLSFHGVPRASGDIDVFIRPPGGNAQRVVDALTRDGAPLDSAGVTVADFTEPGAVYQIGLPPRRVDVLTRLTGVTFDEVWATRLSADVEGRTIPFNGRNALLKNKQATGRPRDLVDVDRLRRMRKEREQE